MAQAMVAQLELMPVGQPKPVEGHLPRDWKVIQQQCYPCLSAGGIQADGSVPSNQDRAGLAGKVGQNRGRLPTAQTLSYHVQ